MKSYTIFDLRFEDVRKKLVRPDAPTNLARASETAIPRALPYSENGERSPEAFYVVFEPNNSGVIGTIVSIPDKLDDEQHRELVREYVGRTFGVRHATLTRR